MPHFILKRSRAQSIPVPLGWQAEGSDTSVRRYVSDLLKAGEKVCNAAPICNCILYA
jgi:hypothetical protein